MMKYAVLCVCIGAAILGTAAAATTGEAQNTTDTTETQRGTPETTEKTSETSQSDVTTKDTATTTAAAAETSSSSSSAAVTTPNPKPAADPVDSQPRPVNKQLESLGCFDECTPGRALVLGSIGYKAGRGSPLSRQQCATECYARNFEVAGLIGGRTCRCGFMFEVDRAKADGRQESSSKCQMECYRNKKATCGGKCHVDVFKAVQVHKVLPFSNIHKKDYAKLEQPNNDVVPVGNAFMAHKQSQFDEPMQSAPSSRKLNSKKKDMTNLTWLWIVIACVAVVALVALVVLTVLMKKKKAGDKDTTARETTSDDDGTDKSTKTAKKKSKDKSKSKTKSKDERKEGAAGGGSERTQQQEDEDNDAIVMGATQRSVKSEAQRGTNEPSETQHEAIIAPDGTQRATSGAGETQAGTSAAADGETTERTQRP